MTRRTCPDCRHVVPAGRWCNRCGAALVEVAAQRPSRRRPALVAGAVAATVGVVAVGLLVATAPGRVVDAGRPADAAVVLAEDPPPPPPPSSPPASRRVVPPGGPPAERVDVVCSDLRQRSIPVTELSTTEVGAVVELSSGACVVMGPEGVAVP